jgi:hypothetical protein
MRHRVKSLGRLYDFIATVVVCAPDRFPNEDFLPSTEQLDLDRAFAELRHGMIFVGERVKDEAKIRSLNETLDAAYAAYRRRDDVAGAHLLQDFQDAIFKR